MYTLRDYQKKASRAGIEYFKNNTSRVKRSNNGIIVAPTGSGKSLIIADIANNLDGKILIFQPRKELLVQNYEKYISYGNSAAVYSASLDRKEIGKVTFATIGSAIKESEKFKEFDYCIIDECHLLPPRDTSMYQQFLSEINVRVLGLTATPIRLKQYSFPKQHSKLNMLDRMRPRAFNHYIHITQIQELVERGYFVKTEYHQVSFDRSQLKINTTGADYTEDSMTFALKEQGVNDKVVESIGHLLESGRKHIVVFTPTIAEAQYVAHKAGGRVIHAKTNKKDREKILKQFKAGLIPFVANVGILGIGFDFPELDTIIIARPTMSLAMYYQWIGRGVRPHPQKDKCMIVDFVGNVERFGRVEDLVIREGEHGWGVYSNKCLLTNRDVAEESSKYREKQVPERRLKDEHVRFGKHKGKKIGDVPKDYLRWVWENVESKSHSKPILDYIKYYQLFEEDRRLINKSEDNKRSSYINKPLNNPREVYEQKLHRKWNNTLGKQMDKRLKE